MNTHAYSLDAPARTSAEPDSTDSRKSIEALLMSGAWTGKSPDKAFFMKRFTALMAGPAEDGIQFGRALLVFKKECKAGELGSNLEGLGIMPNHASSLMQCARRFSADGTARRLLKAIRNSWRLFELLPLKDEQIRALELTGRTGALSVDDIAVMRRAQLRAAVKAACAEPDDCDEEGDEADNGVVGMATPDATEGRLQPGDRIVSQHALRAGSVVKVYPDGSACIVWDDGEPQPEGMGHERVPRAGLVLAPSAPATLGRRTAYALALAKTLVRYANELEVDDLVEELEAQVRQISERRPVPGLVAARYDLFRKFWLQGGAA